MDLKAAIFDLDGLLIDSEPHWKQVETKVFIDLGIPFKIEWCEQTVGMRIDEVVDFWKKRFPEQIQNNSAIVDRIVFLMEEAIEKSANIKPGVNYILNLFHDNKTPIAIASSSFMVLIKAAVKRMAIENKIDTLVSAQGLKHGKPHPDVFLKTAEELKVDPSNCIVFEDSIAGMEAGLSAGMKVVAIPEIHNRSEQAFDRAHLKLESLDQFDLALIAGL